MHFSLDKFLSKRGIEKIEDLTPDEQETLRRYQVILSTEEVTVQQIKDFCTAQLRVIESKADGINPLSNIQQACIHVYINILKAIEAPLAERRSLETHLNQIINENHV